MTGRRLNRLGNILVGCARSDKTPIFARDLKDLTQENLEVLENGFVDLERHLDNLQNQFGLSSVVAIDHFTFDTAAEVGLLKQRAIAIYGDKIVGLWRGLITKSGRYWGSAMGYSNGYTCFSA